MITHAIIVIPIQDNVLIGYGIFVIDGIKKQHRLTRLLIGGAYLISKSILFDELLFDSTSSVHCTLTTSEAQIDLAEQPAIILEVKQDVKTIL